MADMLITVGVDPKLSYDAVQPGLTELLKDINAKPLQIKVEFEEASLKAMRDEIKNIFGNLPDVKISQSVDKSIRNIGNAAKATKAQTSDLSKSIDELVLRTRNYEGSSRSASRAVDTYRNSVNGTITAISKQLDASGKVVKSSTQVTEAYKTSAQKAKEVAIVNKQTRQELSHIDKLEKNLLKSNNGDLSSIDKLEGYKTELRNIRSEYAKTGDLSKFKTELTKLQTKLISVKSDIDKQTDSMRKNSQQLRENASAAKAAAAAEQTTANVFKQITSEVSVIDAQQRRLKDAGGENTYLFDGLKKYKDKLRLLQESYTSTGDYSAFKTGLTELQTQIISTKSAIDEYVRSQSAMNRETEKAAAAEQKRDAMSKQYFNTLGRGERYLKQYSAAKRSRDSSSREAYSAINEAVGALRKYESAVKDNSIPLDELRNKISAANRVLTENVGIIQRNDDAHKSLVGRMGGLVQKFGAWLTVSQVIMQAVRAVRKMVTASIEIDSAMTQLKIVTGATDSEMTRFLSNATVLAKELGKSITDVAGSIETFSRLGYNLTDASELAKYANVLSNVANTDSETATTGLTSIIKGYSMDVSEAEHVSDVLIKVGQEYAISAEELMAAFQRGGAALYASGTDFEKSAALFAATNASLQNAESVGTMWKTVSARIRGATTELAEMGEETEGLADGLSKYRKEIKALSGVDIMKDENTYKDMYDIFVELAKVWDSMKSDEARSRVAEILGGTRQLSGIMSTITNIKDAIGAYEGAIESAGTTASAQAKIMDSVEGRIGVFKATFQELSADMANSDIIKGVVDFGTTVLNIIDDLINDIGTLQTLILSIGGSVGTFKIIKNVA